MKPSIKRMIPAKVAILSTQCMNSLFTSACLVVTRIMKTSTGQYTDLYVRLDTGPRWCIVIQNEDDSSVKLYSTARANELTKLYDDLNRKQLEAYKLLVFTPIVSHELTQDVCSVIMDIYLYL